MATLRSSVGMACTTPLLTARARSKARTGIFLVSPRPSSMIWLGSACARWRATRMAHQRKPAPKALRRSFEIHIKLFLHQAVEPVDLSFQSIAAGPKVHGDRRQEGRRPAAH